MQCVRSDRADPDSDMKRTDSRQVPNIRISKPVIGEPEKAAVLEVLESGMLVQGRQVAALEAEFAAKLGARHAVAASSGTAALHLALLAHGIAAGDEVITSAFTFVASANSILYAGARPVFVDIDPDTFNIDPRRVEAAITPRTRALMPVHLFGQPCDMDTIMAIARTHRLAVIEDSAQAIGGRYRGRAAGTFGTGCFSLYATKNVMSGEGGMIVTDDDGVAERVRLLRQHGARARYAYETLGFNFRMTDLHAAIARAQLQRLDAVTRSRRRNAAYLSKAIRSMWTPSEGSGCFHVWHQYTIRVEGARDRDKVISTLGDAGIETAVFYPRGVHELEHVRAVAGEYRLPVTEQAAREVVSLPVHPLLTTEDLIVIAEAVNNL